MKKIYSSSDYLPYGSLLFTSSFQSYGISLRNENEVKQVAKNPVCGMEVDETKGAKVEYNGKTYNFLNA